MRIGRIRCPRDRRPQGAGISPEVRLFVFRMQQQGFAFELREDGRVRVGPGRISSEQRLVLRAMFHELKELLKEEQRPL